MKIIIYLILSFFFTFSFILPISSSSSIVLIPKLPICYTNDGFTAPNTVAKACDNNTSTSWLSDTNALPKTMIFPIASGYSIQYIALLVDGAAIGVYNGGTVEIWFNNTWLTDGEFLSTATNNKTIYLYSYGTLLMTSQVRITFKTTNLGNYASVAELWVYGYPVSIAINNLTDIDIVTLAALIFVFAFTFALGERKHPMFFAFSGVVGLSFAYTLYTLITSFILTAIAAGISIILIVYAITKRPEGAG